MLRGSMAEISFPSAGDLVRSLSLKCRVAAQAVNNIFAPNVPIGHFSFAGPHVSVRYLKHEGLI